MASTRVHLEKLTAFLKHLEDALGANGLDESARAETVTAYSGAKCSTCGLILTGSDINVLATAYGSPSEKLSRIKNGYCGRASCKSYFYEFTFHDHPQIDWSKVIAAFESQESAAAVEEKKIHVSAPRLSLRQWLLAGALALVVAGLLVRHYWISGNLPGMKPRYRFRTVEDVSAPTNPPPAVTPASDGRFRTVR